MAEIPMSGVRPGVGSAARTSEESGTLRAGSLRVSAGSAARLSEDQSRSDKTLRSAEMSSASINLRPRGGRIFTPRPVEQDAVIEKKLMNTGVLSPLVGVDPVSHLQAGPPSVETSRLKTLFRTLFRPDEK